MHYAEIKQDDPAPLKTLIETFPFATIADLVTYHEPADGWRFEELDPALLVSWCDMLIDCRTVIATFDLTAKLSQNRTAADRQA